MLIQFPYEGPLNPLNAHAMTILENLRQRVWVDGTKSIKK